MLGDERAADIEVGGAVYFFDCDLKRAVYCCYAGVFIGRVAPAARIELAVDNALACNLVVDVVFPIANLNAELCVRHGRAELNVHSHGIVARGQKVAPEGCGNALVLADPAAVFSGYHSRLNSAAYKRCIVVKYDIFRIRFVRKGNLADIYGGACARCEEHGTGGCIILYTANQSLSRKVKLHSVYGDLVMSADNAYNHVESVCRGKRCRHSALLQRFIRGVDELRFYAYAV